MFKQVCEWFFLFYFRDIHFFSWIFLSFFFCMCIQESILKSEHSGWTWFGYGPVTWLWHDHSIRKFSTCWLGLRSNLQSFGCPECLWPSCLHVCILFPQPLSSIHFHVPLLPHTTLFIKGWNKTSALHRQSSEIRKWLIWEFFSSQKEKKNLFGSLVSPHWDICTVNSTGYFGSSPQRLLFNIANTSLSFLRQWTVF